MKKQWANHVAYFFQDKSTIGGESYNRIYVKFSSWDNEKKELTHHYANILKDFCIYCQMDNSSKKPYAFSWLFKNVDVGDIMTAKLYLHTLEYVSSQLEKTSDMFGLNQTYGQYVLRICSALGIKKYAYPCKDNKSWEIQPIVYIQHDIDSTIEKWLANLTKENYAITNYSS